MLAFDETFVYLNALNCFRQRMAHLFNERQKWTQLESEDSEALESSLNILCASRGAVFDSPDMV